MAVNQSMNEAGILGLLVFPKFFFQTYAAAEKLVWKQINRIKGGDFSDEMFQSLKLEQKREYASKLEDYKLKGRGDDAYFLSREKLAGLFWMRSPYRCLVERRRD